MYIPQEELQRGSELFLVFFCFYSLKIVPGLKEGKKRDPFSFGSNLRKEKMRVCIVLGYCEFCPWELCCGKDLRKRYN